MQRDDLFQEDGFGAGNVLDRLARHRFGQEADEVAGMAGLERHPDFTVGLEPADARAMSRARIDDNEWPAAWVDLDAFRRHHFHQRVVHRSFELAPIDQELHLVVQDVRRGLRDMLAIGRCRAGASHPGTERCVGRRRSCIPPPAQTRRTPKMPKSLGSCQTYQPSSNPSRVGERSGDPKVPKRRCFRLDGSGVWKNCT